MDRRSFFKGIGAAAASLAVEPIPAELLPAYAHPAYVTYWYNPKYPLQYIRFTFTIVWEDS
jgi:hypothetical protein